MCVCVCMCVCVHVSVCVCAGSSVDCATPATLKLQDQTAPGDAKAYIRPLGTGNTAMPATQKLRTPNGTRRHQGIHPTPLAVEIVPRLPPHKSCGGQTAPGDASAYFRPLGSGDSATPATQKLRRPNRTRGHQGVHPTPWQWRLCHACHAKAAETNQAAETKRHQGTPRRTTDPLAVEIVPRLPRKSCGDQTARGDAKAYIQVCVRE